jgi:hypothetical protein
MLLKPEAPSQDQDPPHHLKPDLQAFSERYMGELTKGRFVPVNHCASWAMAQKIVEEALPGE